MCTKVAQDANSAMHALDKPPSPAAAISTISTLFLIPHSVPHGKSNFWSRKLPLASPIQATLASGSLTEPI